MTELQGLEVSRWTAALTYLLVINDRHRGRNGLPSSPAVPRCVSQP